MKIKLLIAAMVLLVSSSVFAKVRYVDDKIWVIDDSEVVTLVQDPENTQTLEVVMQGENGKNATVDGVVIKGCLEGTIEVRYIAEPVQCTVYKGYSQKITIENFGATTHAYGTYALVNH